MYYEGWAPASHLAMARAKEAGLQMKAVAHAWAIGIVCGKAMETCEIAGMLIEARVEKVPSLSSTYTHEQKC